MEKIRVGVLGAFRGMAMIKFLSMYPQAELVAICDKSDSAVENCKKKLIEEYDKHSFIKYFYDFEDFLHCEMDAVVLANYANEHAPFAIKCLEKGLHVISEVLPCQTMSEAVRLVEAVEKSKKVYAYAENYCYMPAPTEMRRLYKKGSLGEFQYGEGEYVHDCVPIWPNITYGDKNHWRNNTYATFYCTHSLGPLIHITGLKPVSVVGFELPLSRRILDVGCKGGIGSGGLELVTLENGAIIKSFHACSLIREPSSVWYSMYATKGMMESNRFGKMFERCNIYYEGMKKQRNYTPKPVVSSEIAKALSGHGGGDFYTMYYFMEKILGNPEGENSIDVYEALDMFLPGLLGYKSIIQKNIAIKIPNLRNAKERNAYRNDHFCTDKKVAGDQYVPPYSKGEIEIADEIYEKVKKNMTI